MNFDLQVLGDWRISWSLKVDMLCRCISVKEVSRCCVKSEGYVKGMIVECLAILHLYVS